MVEVYFEQARYEVGKGDLATCNLSDEGRLEKLTCLDTAWQDLGTASNLTTVSLNSKCEKIRLSSV